MKFLVCALSFVSSLALAQSVGVKDIPAEGDTTIRVEKGSRQNRYNIVTNADVVEGDAAPLLKEARANWKTACAEWKKETKELNQENKVISLNCGSMKCETTAMETTCRSSASSKIRVQVD